MNTATKRTIYIALFSFLGILLSLIVHGVVEIWYIDRLTTDFNSYSMGYSWGEWFVIHKYFSIFLSALGAVFGYYQGRYWWRVVYEKSG